MTIVLIILGIYIGMVVGFTAQSLCRFQKKEIIVRKERNIH